MKPIDFKQSNVTLIGKGTIKPLPAYRCGGVIMSCWRDEPERKNKRTVIWEGLAYG